MWTVWPREQRIILAPNASMLKCCLSSARPSKTPSHPRFLSFSEASVILFLLPLEPENMRSVLKSPELWVLFWNYVISYIFLFGPMVQIWKRLQIGCKKTCTVVFSIQVRNIQNNHFYHFRNYKLSLTIALSRLPTLYWWSNEIPWHTLVTSLLGLNGYLCLGMVVVISWKISSGWMQCFSCKRDTFRPFDRSDARTCSTGWRGRKVEWYKTPGSWWSKSCTPDVRQWRLRPKLRHLLHLVANQEYLE